MQKTGVCIGLAVLLTGCFFKPLPFNEAEYRALTAFGTGRVQGQLFLRAPNGEIKTGAGAPIRLHPATQEETQAYSERCVLQHIPTAARDPQFNFYDRRTTADIKGRFELKNVPPGPYWLWSRLTWETLEPSGLPNPRQIIVRKRKHTKVIEVFDPSENNYLPRPQGGVLATKIVVRNGKTTKVILANSAFCTSAGQP